MGSTLAFVPFERALIFPTWAVLRCVFVLGSGLSLLLHAGARRLVGE